MQIIRTSTIIAALLCGTVASADVTAQQVWDNWTGQMDIYGQGFTTTGETMSGDTLTVSGVKIEMSDEEAAITAEIGDIALTENGDGTVSITLAESYPVTLNFTPEYGDPTVVNLSVQQDAMVLLVSGDPDAMVYDISADRYAFVIDSMELPANSDVDFQTGVVAMMDIAGKYAITEDTLSNISYEFAMGALDIDALFTDIESGGEIKANGDIADLAMFAQIALPIDMDTDAEMPPFTDGLAMEGGYSFGDLAYSFGFDVGHDVSSGTATAEGGTLSFAFDVDRMSYTGETRGIDVSVSMPKDIPFPLEASMEKYGYDFLIPLSQGEDGPRDARFAFNITELVLSDMLWAIGDPQNLFPREPLTVALDLDAQVTPYFDFLDPEQMEAAAMAEIPGEVNGVQLNSLTIRGAGAEITGDGAFTFDNDDLQTFDGYPRPEGQASFAINGANALMDKLIQMGLIPEDQAMMPRMMMGMFTTPAGDDMLTTSVEINSDAHVIVNGQRLR